MERLKYLSKNEMKAMDKLKEFYGGNKKISATVEERRNYEYRKQIAVKKGFGKFLEDAEGFARRLPKVDKFRQENNIKITKKGIATAQVSAWQGCKPTYYCLKKAAENGNVFLPKEMIAVVALSDDYVYSGDLLTTLTMCENIMGVRFCSSSLLGTPLPAHRFDRIQKITDASFDTIDAGNDMKQLRMSNMGTFFGNFCGIEVGNDNHLVYLDSITRTALETGADFFLNPSWSTIAAASYYCRDIPNISFKISCFLGLQNTVQFRILLNLLNEYRRRNETSPICEINIGNAINADKFMACKDMLKASGIKGISLTAHILINTDLGYKDFNWFNNALKVLGKGYDMTLKYESDGACSPDDTIASYFLSKEDRESKAEVMGEVLYKKVVVCDSHAKKLLKLGHDVKFADISQK